MKQKDSLGNEFEIEVTVEGNKIVEKKTWFLPEGKTTPKGAYQKFLPERDCPFPERADCNSGPGYSRCEFMKFVSLGNWACKHKKI